MLNTRKIFASFLILLFSSNLFSSTLYPEHHNRVIQKSARPGDEFADRYRLSPEGQLMRVKNGHAEDLIDQVAEFKVSQHLDDDALLYFIRGEELDQANLWYLSVEGELKELPDSGNIKSIDNEFRYGITPKAGSKIVLLSLHEDNTLKAWGTSGLVKEWEFIRDYYFNPSFGKKGKPFSHYVAFLLDATGKVIKVHGDDPSKSVAEAYHTYGSITEFLKAHGLRS